MIIKLKTRKTASFAQLIQYILRADERVSDSHTILHNLTGSSPEEWVEEFEQNEAHRRSKRKNSVILSHEILSWHPDDARHLSLPVLEDLALEYIRLRNPLGLYLGAIHMDQDHYHLHFCVSGVEFRSGKAMRLSKAGLSSIKESLQAYQRQRYPELFHSLPNHGQRNQSGRSDPEIQFSQRTGEMTTKGKITEMIMALQEQSTDTSALLQALESQGVQPYFRRGKWVGVSYKGRKYRLATLGFALNRQQSKHLRRN